MAKIAMILRKPPYGDINAAEAVRHAMGGVTGDLSVDLILVDGGVFVAKKGQDVADSGFTNMGDTVKDCVDMGVNVYADKNSLKEQNLESADLVDGIKILNGFEIAALIGEAEKTMIF